MYQLALLASERNIAFDTPVLRPNDLRCESNGKRRLTPTSGLTSVADYFRRTKTSGPWRVEKLPPEDLPMPELLAAVYFAASDPPPHCGSFGDPGLAQRQHRGLRVY